MPLTNYKSKEFLRLKDEWDKRLAASGFEDVETYDRRTGESLLREWDSVWFQLRNDPDEFEAKAEYYHMCEQFLHTHNFKSKTDRQIWQQHARGLGVRKIAEYLKERGVKTNKDVVNESVNRLKARMKEATTECRSESSSQLDLWSQQIVALSSRHG